MPSFWDRFGAADDAIRSGIFDPQGANYPSVMGNAPSILGDNFSSRFGASFPRSITNLPGASVATSVADTATSVASTATEGASKVLPGAGFLGSTKIEPLDALSDLGGFIGGSGTGKPINLGLQGGTTAYVDSLAGGAKSYINEKLASLEDWVIRIILVVLGLIFVAVGLSMFGVNVVPQANAARAIKTVGAKLPK